MPQRLLEKLQCFFFLENPKVSQFDLIPLAALRPNSPRVRSPSLRRRRNLISVRKVCTLGTRGAYAGIVGVGRRPKPRAARGARVTIKTRQKPETALEKSLAPRV